MLVSVLTTDTSAEAAAVPLLPSSSVSFELLGSGSSASTVTTLSNAPAASMVAMMAMFSNEPLGRLGMVQGKAEQLVLCTLVMVRLVGVSVTTMLLAVDGPLFVTTMV